MKDKKMRVAFLSYPMLWQRCGGLQVQIRETMNALKNCGIDVQLFDVNSDQLSNYDVIHVFSAINGTHRILEEAKAQNIPTVLSPILQTDLNYWKVESSRFVTKLAHKLTNYRIQTSFNDIRIALELSDHIVVLSRMENEVIGRILRTDNFKSTIVKNGVLNSFFKSSPELFIEKTGLDKGYILVVGSVSSYKNQLGVIKAAEQFSRLVVLVGPIADHDYFKNCMQEGGSRVYYAGEIDHDDPLLPSCYTAASVTVLASKGEAFGNVVIESLAAGTPAIITKKNGLEINPTKPSLQFVNSQNYDSIRSAISIAILSERRNKDCKKIVSHFLWENVANQLLEIYEKVIG